jgi:hypothetical protein
MGSRVVANFDKEKHTTNLMQRPDKCCTSACPTIHDNHGNAYFIRTQSSSFNGPSYSVQALALNDINHLAS